MLVAPVVLLTVLMLAIAACGPDSDGPDPTPPVSMSTQPETPVTATAITVAGVVPPCTPIQGSSVDPCEPDVAQVSDDDGLIQLGPEPASVRWLLDGGRGRILVGHLVVRGTYIPGTVRCIADNTARYPSYTDWPNQSVPSGVSEFKCYADVRVNAYVVGSGPSTLTVLVWPFFYWYDETPEDIERLRSYFERVFIEGGDEHDITVPAGGISGREAVLFLGPAIDVSVESWRVFTTWDVQRREDGMIVVVHPNRNLWRNTAPTDYQTYRSRLEMELPAFTQAATAAHQARMTEYGGRIGPDENLPMLITGANQLRRYYNDVGAYDHPDGPPSQPPAAYACDSGTAVTDSSSNRGLVRDCSALLDGKDTLRGTAALNWGVDTAITGWDGITTGGTPGRVTKVELPNKSLSGSIPAGLGELFTLTHLDLSNNSLTGEIPEELDRLENLEEIRLSGNSLTGCIPLSLKDVATNDLSSLNLLYCPPTPGNLSSGMVGEASIALSWNAVSSTSKYRVEYWDPAAGSWVVADDTLTGTSHAVDGLTCEREYRFRVSAYGSGTTYAAEWSEWSASLTASTASTAACAPPVFVSTPEPSYLTEEILPCTPISGTSVDPCEPGVVPMVSGSGAGIFALGSEPWGLRWFMDPAGGGHETHLVLRGTYIPGTVRCDSSGESFRWPRYTGRGDGFYRKSVVCYADVRVGAYVLGSGPPTLTVMVSHDTYSYPSDTSEQDIVKITEIIEETRDSFEVVLIQGGRTPWLSAPTGGIGGREAVLFIGPSADASLEAWEVFPTWGVEQREDGTVIAVHPHRNVWERKDSYQTHRSKLEMTLPAFKQAVATANQERVTEYDGRTDADPNYAMLVTDANRLGQFFTSIGAYDHPDGPPSQPPAAYACDNDTAVTDSSSNRGLVHDCSTLLDAKDTLRGAAALNWGVDTAITGWDGITTGGTPSRVTKVELSNKSLNGSIPAGLGRLLELTHLDLSNNSLTGEIPEELDRLQHLTSLSCRGILSPAASPRG